MNPDNLSNLIPLPVWKDYIDALYMRLMSDYRSRRINNEQLQGLFTMCVFVDKERNLWSIGQQTGRWYIRKDDEWQLGEPPQMLYTLATEEAIQQVFTKGDEELTAIPRNLVDPAVEDNMDSNPVLACPRCGKSNPTDRLYCTNCGSNLVKGGSAETRPKQTSHETTRLVCRVCGAENLPDKKFCTQCGSQLEGAAGGTS